MSVSKTKRNRTNKLLKKLVAERTKKAAPAGTKKAVRKCTRCGCTEDSACQPFGCWWVGGLVDVCSECATGSELRQDAEQHRKPGTGLGRR